ncbi:Oxidoreductase NAD-binding domain-containing protein 1 [Bulinus truncatus]|nr:Oxidoreductase NAD-binding domain-containing protein 1 [Bulinus truncatus]
MHRLISSIRNSIHNNFTRSIYVQLMQGKMLTASHASTHIDKTAFNTGQEIISEAVVKEISILSETVKLVKLEVKEEKFSFKAGQWVDMFIPGVNVVGGFSMCSPPHLLETDRILHLAIKYSNHPPAKWIHTQCTVGDQLHLRAGGDFVYDPDPSSVNNDLVLIAGGVGINPLFSMLQHFIHIHHRNPNSIVSQKMCENKAVLFYSAQSGDELIFMNELIQLSQKYNNVTVKMFSTREKVENEHITNGRIQFKDIGTVLTSRQITKNDVYICGPLSFIETMETFCAGVGYSRKHIHIERWW